MKAPYLGDRLEVDRAPEQVLLVMDRAAVKWMQLVGAGLVWGREGIPAPQAGHPVRGTGILASALEVQPKLQVVDRADIAAVPDRIVAAPSHIVVVAYRVAVVVAHKVAAYPGHSRCIQMVPPMTPQMVLRMVPQMILLRR